MSNECESPSSPFFFIPEPFRAVFKLIQPGDLYVLTETRWGECVGMRHIKGDDSARDLFNAQNSHNAAQHLRGRTISGRALRSLIIELARADGRYIPHAPLDAE